MRCLSKRLSVEGAIASIKSVAKTCQQIALEKGQIHIFNKKWRNWTLLSFDQFIYSPYISPKQPGNFHEHIFYTKYIHNL